MQYLLMIYASKQSWQALTEAERWDVQDRHRELCEELMASGEYVSGEPLAGPLTGKAVRVRNGQAVVTDGPFLEVKEHLAGYDLVDCDSVERAVEIAARLPEAAVCGVEVRPVIDLAGAGVDLETLWGTPPAG